MAQRWIVDAMNVIGSRPDGWWKDRDEAMRSFAVSVDDHARTSGKSITVVFDGDPSELPETASIDVVISRWRGSNAADRAIEELVAGDEEPVRLRVVTSDRALIDKVTALGAKVVSSSTFRAELTQ